MSCGSASRPVVAGRGARQGTSDPAIGHPGSGVGRCVFSHATAPARSPPSMDPCGKADRPMRIGTLATPRQRDCRTVPGPRRQPGARPHGVPRPGVPQGTRGLALRRARHRHAAREQPRPLRLESLVTASTAIRAPGQAPRLTPVADRPCTVGRGRRAASLDRSRSAIARSAGSR